MRTRKVCDAIRQSICADIGWDIVCSIVEIKVCDDFKWDLLAKICLVDYKKT